MQSFASNMVVFSPLFEYKALHQWQSTESRMVFIDVIWSKRPCSLLFQSKHNIISTHSLGAKEANFTVTRLFNIYWGVSVQRVDLQGWMFQGVDIWGALVLGVDVCSWECLRVVVLRRITLHRWASTAHFFLLCYQQLSQTRLLQTYPGLK